MKISILALVTFAFLGIGCKPSSHLSSAFSSTAADTSALANKTEAETADDVHSSRNALDWAGMYTGTLPCADCDGIATEIELTAENRYVMRTKYMGKSDNAGTEQKGTFSWNPAGSVITLEGAANMPQQYKVTENGLIQLDKEGNEISGNLAHAYVLRKTTPTPSAPNVVETRWRLVELRGKPVDKSSSGQDPFIMLTTDGTRISGFTGCNTVAGMYTLGEGNQIQFSQMASTKKACMDMSVESQLLEVLRTADNYSINGHQLSLNKARMAPLARFEAVE